MRVTIRLTPNSEPPQPPPVKYDGWRVLHKVEGGWQNTPLWMPEVLPPINPVAVKMTQEIQLMSWELMSRRNPSITRKQWTSVHKFDRAFTNKTGFGMEGNPRANYVTGDDLTAPLPAYDKCQRQCGGNFLRGETRYSTLQALYDFGALVVRSVLGLGEVVRDAIIAPRTSLHFTARRLAADVKRGVAALSSDNMLVCVPGIHCIDSRKPIPSIEEIIENHWYLYAVTLYGEWDEIDHFPQGNGGPVLIPFIADREISFPLYCFERWQADGPPDPLKVYKVV